MDSKDRELRKDGKLAVASASEPAGATEAGALPARTDELYRHGEDLYSLGLYDQAVHVWTRILFIERGDTRAKAAIDRAKRALSERQRELDVEIAEATRLLDDGRNDEAAEKIRHVLMVDPRHAEGHHLAQDIAAIRRRREQAGGAGGVETEALTGGPSKRGLLLRVSGRARSAEYDLAATLPTGPAGNASTLKMAAFVLGAVLLLGSGALALHLNWDSIVSDGRFRASTALAPTPGTRAAEAPVGTPVPDASELHYYNGARLYAKGRYREALLELSDVGRDSATFERARGLVLRIEERLLRGGAEPSASSTNDSGSAPRAR